jgi:hypothetical protein
MKWHLVGCKSDSGTEVVIAEMQWHGTGKEACEACTEMQKHGMGKETCGAWNFESTKWTRHARICPSAAPFETKGASSAVPLCAFVKIFHTLYTYSSFSKCSWQKACSDVSAFKFSNSF